MPKKAINHLDDVFVPGGLPTVTYVDRASLGLEREIKKALALRYNFVSITGASKSGKTTLLYSVMGDQNFVGVDSGQVHDVETLWATIADRLSQPSSFTYTTEFSDGTERIGKIGGAAKIPHLLDVKLGFEAGRGKEERTSRSTQRLINLQNACGDYLIENNVILAIDDFHNIDREGKKEIVRNLKSLVFKGLKVVFLSVSYRPYEAIKAETDLSGRVIDVDVPEWSKEHLKEIAIKGFDALNVEFPDGVIDQFAMAADGSPQLMQRFCWETCFDLGITETAKRLVRISDPWDPSHMFSSIAEAGAKTTYDKLAAGPQSRKERISRPLRTGESVDIYEALLFAIAQTGPKKSLTYNEIRASLQRCLEDRIPNRIEISNALNHLSKIALTISETNKPIDWDDNTLELPDPMFRFFLKFRFNSM